MENKRLRWGCRRGMLELDSLLMPFFDNYFAELSNSQKKTFEELLTYSDADLYNWFIGTEKPGSSELFDMIEFIKIKVGINV